MGSQRRRGFSRDAGLNARDARCPVSVSFTGMGRSHAAFTGSAARDSGEPRAPGKAFWPCRQITGLHLCGVAKRDQRARLPAWIRHHALLGGPFAGEVGHATGRAHGVRRCRLRTRGYAKLALTVAIHVTAIGEDNRAQVAIGRLVALRRTGDGQRAADLEHVRGPARSAQRIDRPHFAAPVHHLAIGPLHVDEDPGMGIDQVDAHQRAGDRQVLVEVPVGDAVMGRCRGHAGHPSATISSIFRNMS